MFKESAKKEIYQARGQRGFTLIETFVAITILMIAVLGPMTLLSRALQESHYIKDQMVASYLAQEGVELVIHYRNNTSSGFDSAVADSDPYTCGKFYWHEGTGFDCIPSGGVATNFSRLVTISNQNAEGEALATKEYLITSTVSYLVGTNPKMITASSFIFIR